MVNLWCSIRATPVWGGGHSVLVWLQPASPVHAAFFIFMCNWNASIVPSVIRRCSSSHQGWYIRWGQAFKKNELLNVGYSLVLIWTMTDFYHFRPKISPGSTHRFTGDCHLQWSQGIPLIAQNCGDTVFTSLCKQCYQELKELHSLSLWSTLSWQKGSIFAFNYYFHQHFQEAELQDNSLLLAQCCVYFLDTRGEDKNSICSRLEIYPICYQENFLFCLFIYFKLWCILFHWAFSRPLLRN